MRIFLTTCLLALVSVACAGAGDPAETVESYMQAKVDGDAERFEPSYAQKWKPTWSVRPIPSTVLPG